MPKITGAPGLTNWAKATPNMDGYELARTIRQNEEGADMRLPIVAITASAMQEDAQFCYEAGMDDFLVKPVDRDKLKETLLRWMPAAASAEKSAPAEPAQPDEPGDMNGSVDAAALVDVGVLKEAFDGDADSDLLRHMLQVFIDPANDCRGIIEKAVIDRVASDVEAAAHRLKSSSRSIGARDLAEVCETLEMAGKAGDWETIDGAAPRFAPALDAVLKYIETY